MVFDYYAKKKINDRGWIIAVLRKPISVVAVPIKVPARRVLDLESNEGPIGNTEMDKLAKLHELKEKDILTEEEFLVEKRKILKPSSNI